MSRKNNTTFSMSTQSLSFSDKEAEALEKLSSFGKVGPTGCTWEGQGLYLGGLTPNPWTVLLKMLLCVYLTVQKWITCGLLRQFLGDRSDFLTSCVTLDRLHSLTILALGHTCFLSAQALCILKSLLHHIFMADLSSSNMLLKCHLFPEHSS